MRTVTARKPDPARPRLRFPCGHVEGQRTVNRRLRTTERAAWVACRRCNLVTLVVAVGARSR
jgi:hypothetical protein